MQNDGKNVALIPARGGSKGLPGKNLKLICGKPLIAWSIEHALKSRSIDQVYVSSDCPKIMQIARDFGAKVPFQRPDDYSKDTSSTEDVVMHFINWADVNTILINNIALLQPTSPFRYSGRLDEAMKQFVAQEADSLVSVSKVHKFIWRSPHSPQASYDVYNRPRRQDIDKEDEIYFENGSIYITRSNIYRDIRNRLGGKISLFSMTPEESDEIDDISDFERVEFFMNKYRAK